MLISNGALIAVGAGLLALLVLWGVQRAKRAAFELHPVSEQWLAEQKRLADEP